jgi:hypothetical protein
MTYFFLTLGIVVLALLLAACTLGAVRIVRREFRRCAATVSPRRARLALWVIRTWPVWVIGVFFASGYAVHGVIAASAAAPTTVAFDTALWMTTLLVSSIVVGGAIWWATHSA